MDLKLLRIGERWGATFGVLFLADTPHFVTLELAWKDNAKRESRIPAGSYKATRFISQKFGDTFLIENVPNRDGILIHAGNFTSDSTGCILIGRAFYNQQDEAMITESRDAMRSFRQLTKGFDSLDIKIIDILG